MEGKHIVENKRLIETALVHSNSCSAPEIKPPIVAFACSRPSFGNSMPDDAE